ncbi:hypothetical protein C0992_007772 [Termitomyces sp. T32_za158]|nr:hypothetical protein C0992_007772 [Termitomyces sp. T32_za158]
MLSLFRHATRRPVRPALVARFSATPSAKEDSSALTEAREILEKEADSQQQSSREFAGGGNASPFRSMRKPSKWKPFRHEGFVQPHDFTYKARTLDQPTYQTRRAQQGPPSPVARYNDVFHQLDINPLDVASEVNVISYYVSEMGKIYARYVTGLTSKNQRRLGKAIRRARMMGVIPILSKSPYFQFAKNRAKSK